MEASSPEMGIRFQDRVFVDGSTTSGKSTLINHIAASFRCQVLLYDTKDEFTVPGVDAVHTPEGIDWSQRLIHVIDDAGELKETNRLFRAIWHRKVGRSEHKDNYGLVIVIHELGDTCADQPGATPQWLSQVIRKGAAHKIGMVYGSQRPRNIPRVARTEAMHTISMARGLDPEDTQIVAGMHRMSVPEFQAALARASELGDFAALWYDKRARKNVILPPLGPGELRETLAHGIDVPNSGKTPGEREPDDPGEFREPEPLTSTEE